MTNAREYLLGLATATQCATIEDQYFASEQSRQAIEADEDQLIEDYLSGALSRGERQQFERHYLASPVHRRRVELVRALSRPASRSHAYRWLAAAAVLFLTIGGVWMFAPRPSPNAPIATTREIPKEAPPPATPGPSIPTVFAFALSPVTVRGSAPASRLVIPPSTDIVRLELQPDSAGNSVTDPMVTIRTVDGRDVWQGAAIVSGLRAGLLARVDVPAVRLTPDDYLIELGGYRYFLPVRSRE